MLSGISSRLASGSAQKIQNMVALAGLTTSAIELPCWRLETLLRQTGIDVVDYLSIDVEGAEHDVLMGMDFATTHVNVIGLESNPRFEAILAMLTEVGFEYMGLLGFDEIFVNRDLRFSWRERD